MLSITKIFEFEACHWLPMYKGACHNLHGHSYKLEVTIQGEPIQDMKSPNYGMIMDFKSLKALVKEVAVDKYDHSTLNDFFPNPTAEFMVRQIAMDIIACLPKGVILTSCKLWETSTSYAKWSIS